MQIEALFSRFAECPTHREQTLLLTSMVHAIQLGSMQSLIWNDVGKETT